jgi:LPXTG-site transpeptidase (sortase) family protein
MFRMRSRTLRLTMTLVTTCAITIGPIASTSSASPLSTDVSTNETPSESQPRKKTPKKTQKNDTSKNNTSQRSSVRLPREGTRLGMMFIPRLKMRSPIVEGVTDPMFDLGMGHWPGTAMPGERGNAVYGGHRTAGPAPLYYVERLQVGDPIIILKGLKKVEYRVISKRIVKPTALWITHQSSGSMLTLFSCHPRHSTKQRYVIQAILKK